MCDCNKNKYINNKIKEEFSENFKEDFSLEKPKDLCHYTCSEINTTNIILFILIILLIYLIIKK